MNLLSAMVLIMLNVIVI